LPQALQRASAGASSMSSGAPSAIVRSSGLALALLVKDLTIADNSVM
jgi:hypothetical protein